MTWNGTRARALTADSGMGPRLQDVRVGDAFVNSPDAEVVTLAEPRDRDADPKLTAADLAHWAAFLPTVRVGGALPVTFRPDGDHVIVEVIVPYVSPAPETQTPAEPNKIPIRIAEGFPVPLTARYRLPAFHAENAADFVRHIVREIYKHEIDEQLRVGDRRPFAPGH